MTRIISGSAGGRRLLAPKGDATRPTSDRVREALFGALEARGLIEGARVLDLFCGSGALGLEAMSRGAASAVLVDAGRPAVEAARTNVATLKFTQASVVLSPVQKFLESRSVTPVDLVLADPPYPLDEAGLGAMLTSLAERGWLAQEATVVLERSGRSPEPEWPKGMFREALRRYGETAVWQAVWDPETGPGHESGGGGGPVAE
ncbi:16S rRNA (guanine(966)-N(2))-methyltransferase RsmD [Kineosporia rhizophila]|uniref:16S rRNA (guanine(966)-N(2))-methyltransferase RsmD n=1 Tax=Kineosporia rhizophila TaxID=84633 RepID=UPI001E316408|nr:16S rRNA (guanine(966)-N(2))-methyltransferase RsmD [Kineosporia rhizophila]MCE0538987.1 16S rRNA (guanine(966)-N(2))-methyltransferase RsmD [Kineosporia rhizophila]